jgi:hypothetical protein
MIKSLDRWLEAITFSPMQPERFQGRLGHVKSWVPLDFELFWPFASRR